MNEFPEFLIYAPPFTYKSAGCRALYRLCHLLNRSGTSARIIPYEPAGSEWDTPFLLPAVQDSVVIYPETVHGNPLWARKVVRWALNYPGNLGGDSIYGPDEMVFVYLRDMIPRVNCSTPEPLGPDRVLYVPVIDPKHIYPDPSVPKEIDSVFTYKGKELKRQFPTPPRDDLVRVEENTPSPSSLGNLLRRTRTLYSYDHASTILIEAAICGCNILAMHKDGRWLDPRTCGCEYQRYWDESVLTTYAARFDDPSCLTSFLTEVRKRWRDGTHRVAISDDTMPAIPQTTAIRFWVDVLANSSRPDPGTILRLPASGTFRIQGWAYHEETKSGIAAVELVVDAKVVQVPYGLTRRDVAQWAGDSRLTFVGFQGVIDPRILGAGHHEVFVRFISPDRGSYSESDRFTVLIEQDDQETTTPAQANNQ